MTERKIPMRIRNYIRNSIKKSKQKERSLERPFEKFSRLLWPWSEVKLVLFISLMALLDYVSTYAALKLTEHNQVTEVGPIAKWALQTGGFLKLFFIDVTVIAVLLLLASGARYIYTKWGFPGFGRTAFIFLLIPYAVFIFAVVFNNILVTFLGQ